MELRDLMPKRPCDNWIADTHTEEVCRECLQEHRCMHPEKCKVEAAPVPRFEFVSDATDAQLAAGLPQRKTGCSAGYDFVMPQGICVGAGETVIFKTGIKVYLQPRQVLLLFIRSSIGIRRGIVLANGTGVIDADFADNPENEGNISAALFNPRGTAQYIDAGERYMQGVIMPFDTVHGDQVTAKRTGGIGSTDGRNEHE